MYSERRLTPEVLQGALAIIAMLPALFIGFHLGIYTDSIGSPRVFESILQRGLVCAAPAIVFALLAPRFWLFPAVVYGFGFYCGYTLLDGIGPVFAAALLAPFAALTGQRLGPLPEPSHPELIWLFGIALWFAAFTSFLRRHHFRVPMGSIHKSRSANR